MRLKFKMLTVKQVVSQIRFEDWFVMIDLKDTYFHGSILPQQIPEVCFQGQSIPISGSSLRPSTLTQYVYEVCGCSPDHSSSPGHSHTRLHRRLADLSAVGESSGSTSRCRPRPHESVGVKTKWQEKCAFSITEDHLFRRGVGFDHDAGTDRVDPRSSRESEGRSLTVKQFQQLLGLMAAASNVIPYSLQQMRPLQWWLKIKGFSPRGKSRNLNQGPVLGVPCRHVTLTKDASLTSWGAVMSGRPAQGLWSYHHLSWHINCLEILAMFRALKHFLPDLRDRHVLVRTDNTAVVNEMLRLEPYFRHPCERLLHPLKLTPAPLHMLLSFLVTYATRK
ncbi:ORF V: Enzymatic polyprotein [Labeo rohita]|uniref:ORF V: Enzymatic polyprotein n=1 Tax=Labeo rohita TaxID=84645 RepID=A0ABQ8LPQ1_LABRO|nr:ORF V: Enzymatic polyprotein [Labeo rohita]